MNEHIAEFETILDRMSLLHQEKDAVYGNSFGRTRSKHPNAIAVVLNFKLNRLETLLQKENEEESGINTFESIEDTLVDIANYCVMELAERRLENVGEDTKKV